MQTKLKRKKEKQTNYCGDTLNSKGENTKDMIAED